MTQSDRHIDTRSDTHSDTQIISAQLAIQLQAWAQELGFSQIGVTGVDLSSAEPDFQAWLDRGFHGDMAYMAAHGMRRARPAELVPGTLSVITARMDYLPRAAPAAGALPQGDSKPDGAARLAGR